MKQIIIAIDGHSSCGKSTLAKALAKELQYIYVDTGAMYRAVTLFFIRNHIDLKDPVQIRTALNQINIRFQKAGSLTHTFLNDEDVEFDIRSMEVSEQVSQVAEISAVRKILVREQQQMGQDKGLVMDGRDIGTVVFPEAELKLFMTASIETRTKRRFDELNEKGVETTYDSVGANLTKRDEIDSTRADSPLKQAEDAILVDNSHMTRTEQLKFILKLAMKEVEGANLRTGFP